MLKSKLSSNRLAGKAVAIATHLFIPCLSFILAGCSIYKIDSRDTSLGFYPPKPSGYQVLCLDKLEKPHEVIGTVTVTTNRSRPLMEIKDQMIHEAATMGGDAIMGLHSTDETAVSGDHQTRATEGIFVTYSAQVIVLK